MDISHLFLFIASFILREKKPVLAEFLWHEITTNTSLEPSPRFSASTWVDSSSNLWLFGGKSVLKSNKTETTHLLNDMWKFNPKTSTWHHIQNANASMLPHNLDNLMSCFCGGLGFTFGTHFQGNESFHKLWIYNISLNLWHLKEMPKQVQTGYGWFSLSCNNNQKTVSLFYCNQTSLQLWTFNMKMDKWMSVRIPSTKGFRSLILQKSNTHLTWTVGLNDTVYIYHWSLGNPNNSVLLTITHTNTTITHVQKHSPSCRTGSITWIDSASNLHLLGGKRCDSPQVYSVHWMLKITHHKWVYVKLTKPNPGHRSHAFAWVIGSALWVSGGYSQNHKGATKFLSDIWLGDTKKHVVPIHVTLTPINHLPGDTLNLSMVDKLIISGLVLLVVLAVMVRLCYKRELNQMMSQLRQHRVPYQELSQGDKGSRL